MFFQILFAVFKGLLETNGYVVRPLNSAVQETTTVVEADTKCVKPPCC